MRKLVAFAACVVFLSVTTARCAWCQGQSQSQPAQGQVLQGQVQQYANVTLADVVKAAGSLCTSGGGYPCTALYLQVQGINKDRGCLPIIAAALANQVATQAVEKAPSGTPAQNAANAATTCNCCRFRYSSKGTLARAGA